MAGLAHDADPNAQSEAMAADDWSASANPLLQGVAKDKARQKRMVSTLFGKGPGGQEWTIDTEAQREAQGQRLDEAFGGSEDPITKELYPQMRGPLLASDQPVDTTDAALDFIRDAASGDSERDSSHAIVRNCRFAGGQNGIRITGTENVFNVLVEDCIFADQTGASIVSSGGYAYRWMIRDNEFINNDIHIDVAFTQATIRDNNFGKFTTTAIDLTSGVDCAQARPNDRWMR